MSRNQAVQQRASASRDLTLRARGLRKRYRGTVALHDVSLEVGPGVIVAVLGPSGSGKSTLLHCLALMTPPDDGVVEFGGRSLHGLPERERSDVRRREFGFVFQFGALVEELSLRENVALPLLFAGTPHRHAERQADAILVRLGLDEVSSRRPSEVSGGQAQRAAVARAVVHDPAVIFADEPTGALDSVAGAVVLGMLVELARDRGAAVVLVTHDERVASIADRRVVMQDGRVLEACLS